MTTIEYAKKLLSRESQDESLEDFAAALKDVLDEYEDLQAGLSDMNLILNFLGYSPRRCKKCKRWTVVNDYNCCKCGHEPTDSEYDDCHW
tara:strand:- start:662 stop:931 length:270 start_codon:yes stop_codon:yes gene_type:complete